MRFAASLVSSLPIALNDGTRPALGVMDQPFVGERLWGDGRGAWRRRDGQKARALTSRTGVPLAEARLCTTFPEVGTPEDRAAFDAFEAAS